MKFVLNFHAEAISRFFLFFSLRKLVHNDLSKVNFNSDLTQDPVWANHPESYTDIPRLRKGMVGGQVSRNHKLI